MLSSHSYHKLQSDPSSLDPIKNIVRRSTVTTSNACRLSPVPEYAKNKKTKTTNLKMKVKELRNWLSDLGDKHQDHYHRFSAKAEPPLPHGKAMKENENEDDVLGIQSKPSSASTCPSTAIVEDNDPFAFAAAASFSTSSEDDNSSNNRENSNIDYSNNDGMEPITSREHLMLLLKQAPTTHEEVGSISGSFHRRDDDDRDDESERSMHNYSVFRDQVLLTKAALDAMSSSPSPRNTGKKTLKEHLQEMKEKDEYKKLHKQQFLQSQWTQDSDSDSGKVASYEGDDEYESSKFNTAESLGLSYSSSSKDDSTDVADDATDASSIAPGVLVSKLATVFLNNELKRETLPSLVKERRRRIDPKDLSFLRSSGASCGSSDATPKTSRRQPPPSPPSPTTSVGKGILRFGGPRKTLVERRKEQLHAKFGENRAAVFVQKKTWGQKTPYGKYQRTTRVEKVYK